MLMRRTWFLLFILFVLFFLCLVPVAAQEEEDPGSEPDNGSPPIESEWDGYVPELYARGDKTFVITLGLLIPTVFAGDAL
jgi:hypothetical protein